LRDGEKLKIFCPVCGQHYRGELSYIGRKIKCVNCQVKFRVKAPAEPHRNRGKLICPHCWKRFNEDELLSISRHPFLTGDPVLGELVEKRFKAAVFDSNGVPLDERGEPSPERACPVCHLRFPEILTDDPLFFAAISGAPFCGKSQYLKGLVKRCKQIFNPLFNGSFFAVDPVMDKEINRGRASDFPHRLKLNGMDMKLPHPCLYGLHYSGELQENNRCLVFYDTDGKNLLPGTDDPCFPVSGHLSRTDGIIFLLDPFEELQPGQYAPENILAEELRRYRNLNNLAAGERGGVPLVIGISKFDLTESEIHPVLEDFQVARDGMLDMNGIGELSRQMRELLMKYFPEVVQVAEEHVRNVYYLPVSTSSHFLEERVWACAETPLLVLLAEAGLLPRIPLQGEGVS
jgi:hypothetical protein